MTSILSARTPGERVIYYATDQYATNTGVIVSHILISANLLPKPIGEASVVPYDDSFFLVGGYNGNDGYIGEIYRYSAASDEWIELKAKLKKFRHR